MIADQLTTLHHAVSEAQQEVRGEAMPTYTFRCADHDLAAADEILKRHGTSVPAFLRACLKMLPEDYKPALRPL